MKYIKRQNGEGWAVKNRMPFRIACCDCGLVHNFVITVTTLKRGSAIGVAAERNERATAQKRRSKKLTKSKQTVGRLPIPKLNLRRREA